MSIKTALYKIGLKRGDLVTDRVLSNIPPQYEGSEFEDLFLKHLTIIGDSREQKDWIEKACNYFGIGFVKAVKDKKAGTENLKEGDYTFLMDYGSVKMDYTGVVAYERKGSISEIYNNLKSGDRDRFEREFDRFAEKGYKKVVLLLEYGSNLMDLQDAEFKFIDHTGTFNRRSTGKLVFASLMAWKQRNAKDFEIYQNENHNDMFWWLLNDMYYWWRNEIFNQVKEIEKESENNEN